MTRPDSPDPARAPTPAMAESYSAWIRRVIRAVRSERNLLVSLFDSSVPEPVEHLRRIMVDGFGTTITNRYTSAFTSGNPYVVAQLARHYAVPAG